MVPAIIYVEGTYDRRTPAPIPVWTSGSPPLGDGIWTSRVEGAPRVTVSTIVLVDVNMYARLKYQLQEMSLEFGRADGPGGFTFCHPDTEEGQTGHWMPIVRTPKHWCGVPNAPSVLALWRIVLNLGLFDEGRVEYLNGDRLDLRGANMRLLVEQK
jgi:hypothetical protein